MSELNIFGREKEIVFTIDDFETTFMMSKKRIFLSTIPNIVEDMNSIFPLVQEDLVDELFLLKSSIDEKIITTEEELTNAIKEAFCKEDFKVAIMEFVSIHHTISIEAADKNEELQFTDSMARLIISISIMCRLTIPFISHYLFVNDIKKEDNLTFNTFCLFYEFFDIGDNGEPMDMASKLNKLVTTNVDNTLYSDKVIWNYLRNISLNSKILSIELFKRVIKDIIPKITINKSIISFLHVVLKRQLNFQFTQNIKINYKPITMIKTDNENGNSINPFTKIEQRLVRTNEMDVSIQRQTITSFIRQNNILKTKKEYDYYMQNIRINQLQIKILNFYISKVIGSGINIFLCNKKEFVELLLITQKWLAENKFFLLSKILLSEPVLKTNIKHFNKGQFLMTIIESKTYDKLTKKYNILEDKLKDGKIIISFISEILNSDFNYFPLFNEPKNREFSTDDIPLKNSISELLTFIERI